MNYNLSFNEFKEDTRDGKYVLVLNDPKKVLDILLSPETFLKMMVELKMMT